MEQNTSPNLYLAKYRLYLAKSKPYLAKYRLGEVVCIGLKRILWLSEIYFMYGRSLFCV